MAVPGKKGGWSRADAADRSDRYTRSVLDVPITWLDLSPPSDGLHLKVMEARDGHRVDVWSSEMSLDEQVAWARSQGAWNIRGEHRSRSFLVSFTVDALPAGLGWLAQVPSYEHLDLHPDGKVRLRLSGLRQDLHEVHGQLRRATDAEVVRVVDAEEAAMPARGPPLTAAQLAAIEAAYEAGFFQDPPRTSLYRLAADLGRSPSELSALLARGIQILVEHLLGEGSIPSSVNRSKLLPPPRIGLAGEACPPAHA